MAHENLMLEHLKAIRTTLDDHGERLNRIETRLSGIEHTIGHLYAGAGDDRDAMRALTRRVDRVERRLELNDDI